MASSIEELLDILYDMIDEAKNFPLSSEKCIIERDKALDILDDVRAKFPVELKKANDLLANKNDYISSAKREADAIRKQAEEHVKRLLNEDALALQAKQQADEIVGKAEERSRLLKKAVNEYCEDTLRRTEEAVAEAYDEVKQSRANFRMALNANGGTGGGRAAFDVEAE